MRDDVPAWPPGASRSINSVRNRAEAPYTAAARPPGPPPMTIVSYSSWAGAVQADGLEQSRGDGCTSTRPSTSTTNGYCSP